MESGLIFKPQSRPGSRKLPSAETILNSPIHHSLGTKMSSHSFERFGSPTFARSYLVFIKAAVVAGPEPGEACKRCRGTGAHCNSFAPLGQVAYRGDARFLAFRFRLGPTSSVPEVLPGNEFEKLS